jgi:uncharacterized membrane protein
VICLVGYFGALITFLVMDMVWMLVLARRFYRKELDKVLRDEVRLIPVFLFYLVYIAILLALTVMPHLDPSGQGLRGVIISSLLFGFASYGTYDATNYALMKDWPLNVTIVDILWGTVVTACAAIAGYFVIVSLG